jgi:UDP-N-acetyl-D-mannosaminuronic acid dehydrogenase
MKGGGAPEVAVVGGAGHVGAPLAIVLAHHGLPTLIHDLNVKAMETLASGQLPFLEEGGESLLREVLARKLLSFDNDPASLAGVPYVVVTIGTPIDEFHNPMLDVVRKCIDVLLPHLSDGQTIIMRSTVFPGVTDYVHTYLRERGKRIHVAFCPERVVQGYSVRELQTLPQIISGATAEAEERAAKLFSKIAPKLVRMQPKEAEFAKLISNAYRYIQFAATNQFYTMVESAGVSYTRVMKGLKDDYPRMSDFPSPGFAAGPCLFKDTLQLAAYTNNTFGLGYAAMHINEGLPAYLVSRMQTQFRLGELTVGILGMAFKANSDDIRASLSYKLRKLLSFNAKAVMSTDPFVKVDPQLLPLDETIARSDVLVMGVPHTAYRDLDLRGKPLVDIWNFHRPPTPLRT